MVGYTQVAFVKSQYVVDVKVLLDAIADRFNIDQVRGDEVNGLVPIYVSSTTSKATLQRVTEFVVGFQAAMRAIAIENSLHTRMGK